MTHVLPQVAHEHHERILDHINGIPAFADSLLTAPPDQAMAGIADVGSFLTGTLLPHIDAAERTLYPELERMFQNRHSMAPMRREHDEVRRLVAEYLKLSGQLAPDHVSLGRALALRRVLFQVYALVKIHLAEEEAYLRLVDKGVTDEAGEVLAAALEHPVG
jgi:hypothetical protein